MFDDLSPPEPPEVRVVHVLAIDSTRYAGALATCCSLRVDGTCARCGGRALALTRSQVERGLQSETTFGQIQVRLARCADCGARERVLPCDALPGKVNSVTNVLGAVAEIHDGIPLEAVARRHGVTRQGVAKWYGGLHRRVLDLAPLHRHRAIVTEAGTSASRLLVRFGTFAAEAAHHRGLPSPRPALVRPARSVAEECRTVLGGLLRLLDRLGGSLAAAQLGAELFPPSRVAVPWRGDRHVELRIGRPLDRAGWTP